MIIASQVVGIKCKAPPPSYFETPCLVWLGFCLVMWVKGFVRSCLAAPKKWWKLPTSKRLAKDSWHILDLSSEDHDNPRGQVFGGRSSNQLSAFSLASNSFEKSCEKEKPPKPPEVGHLLRLTSPRPPASEAWARGGASESLQQLLALKPHVAHLLSTSMEVRGGVLGAPVGCFCMFFCCFFLVFSCFVGSS